MFTKEQTYQREEIRLFSQQNFKAGTRRKPIGNLVFLFMTLKRNVV